MLLYLVQILAQPRVPADVVGGDVLLALDEEELPGEVYGVEALRRREDFLQVEEQLEELAVFLVLGQVERQAELVDAVLEQDARRVHVEREVGDGLLDGFEVGVEHVAVYVADLRVGFGQLALHAAPRDAPEDDAGDDSHYDEGNRELHPVERQGAHDSDDQAQQSACVSPVFDYIISFLGQSGLRNPSPSRLSASSSGSRPACAARVPRCA